VTPSVVHELCGTANTILHLFVVAVAAQVLVDIWFHDGTGRNPGLFTDLRDRITLSGKYWLSGLLCRYCVTCYVCGPLAAGYLYLAAPQEAGGYVMYVAYVLATVHISQLLGREQESFLDSYDDTD
jgi:hypothetical protein